MIRRDVIVIGASAGGVQTLQALVSQFPKDLPAAVLVAVHVPSGGQSQMPQILSRSGPLPALHPTSDQVFEPGTIYVAPPGSHMLLEEDRIHLWQGPKEDRHRPAINPLFRSAATCCGGRVAGVILTGMQDDGCAGLWLIKRCGGATVVQQDALFPDMVQSAREFVQIDYAVPLAAMGALLTALACGAIPEPVPDVVTSPY